MKKIKNKNILRCCLAFSLCLIFYFIPISLFSKEISLRYDGIIMDFCIHLSKITKLQKIQAIIHQSSFDHLSNELNGEEKSLLIDCIKEMYIPFIYKLPIANENEEKLRDLTIQELYGELFILNLTLIGIQSPVPVETFHERAHIQKMIQEMKSELAPFLREKYKEKQNVKNIFYFTDSLADFYEKHCIKKDELLSTKEKELLQQQLNQALEKTKKDQQEVIEFIYQQKIDKEVGEYSREEDKDSKDTKEDNHL